MPDRVRPRVVREGMCTRMPRQIAGWTVQATLPGPNRQPSPGEEKMLRVLTIGRRLVVLAGIKRKILARFQWCG